MNIEINYHEPDLLSQSSTSRTSTSFGPGSAPARRDAMMHTQTTRPRPQPAPRPGPAGQQPRLQRAARGDRPQNAPTARSRSQFGPREKVFGSGRLMPLDRNVKVRVMMVARALMRHQEKAPRPPAAPGARCTKQFAPLSRSASCPG